MSGTVEVKAHYWTPSFPPRNFLGLSAQEAGHGLKLQVTSAGRVVASLISVPTTATMLCHGSLSSRAQFPEALRSSTLKLTHGPGQCTHSWLIGLEVALQCPPRIIRVCVCVCAEDL